MTGKHHHHAGGTTEGTFNLVNLVNMLGVLQGDNVLDIGCGNGYLSMAMASRAAPGKVHGIDQHGESLEEFASRVSSAGLDNVFPLQCDFTGNVALPDGSASMAVMLNVLHGFIINDEMRAVNRNLVRLLAGGARLAIIEPLKIEGMRGPPLEDRIEPEEALAVLSPAGFIETRRFSPSTEHWGMMLRLQSIW